jgi:hypothetical protein
MLDYAPGTPSPICRRVRVLACLSVLGLGASPASALPPLEPGPAPGLLLVEGEPPVSPAEAAVAPTPQPKPALVVDEHATPARSAIAQPSVPQPTSKTDASQSADSRSERSGTELSMEAPTAPPAEANSRLAGFRADIKVLNELELSTEGVNLFSGIASVNGRTVDVGATAAWDSLPAIGKKSYLDSLLVYWAFAQGGEGPAVVRIVDPSGRVLAEKSWQ